MGKTKPHAWNTAWIFDKDRVIISEIDLTSYDYNGRLEADSYHIEKNPDIMKMKIAEACNDYENALKYLDNFYYTKTGDNFRKLIYKKSMYSAFLFTDEFSGYSKKQKNEFAKKILKAHQEAVDMNSYFVRHYDIILENAIGAYYSLGNIKKAHNLAKNFESRFGKSPFSENSIWGNLRFGN